MKLPLNAACQREYYPLTFNQLGIWLLHQTSPGDPVLYLSSRVRFKGTLQVEKLDEALTLLIKSNSTLRTRFIIVNNEPYQFISPNIKPDLTYIDLSERLKFEREVEARILTERESRKPFDLFKGPLARFMLIKLEEDDHLFLFNIHHIISDATSLNLIWEKLISLYNGLVKTGTGNLTPMKVHYHDFALWQHQAFNHDYFKHQEQFWLKEFPGKVPQVTSFPADLKTRSALDYNGSTYETQVDKEFAANLKKFSFRHKVNLFTTLLAAFQILLHKFTGQEDLVIGVYFSARQNQPGLFFSIGWLINVLPLRIRIFPGQTVPSFLKSLRDKVSRVYLNQDYPLLKLIRKINPQRFSNRLPLFQVVFNMVPANLPNTSMAGLSAGDREILDNQTSQYDLTVIIFDRPTGLTIKFEYSTNLYKRDTIIKLMEHYQIILRKMLTDPEAVIGKLDILTPGEKQKLTAWLNHTNVEYDKSKCIHTLFEEQSGRTPDSLALVFEHQHLTYHELNRRANCLAGILQAKGVKLSMVVGTSLRRSAELMTGIFGILKAGGIYLPLDPDYPAQRIEYIVKDSGIKVMLTQIPNDRDGIDITDPALYDGNGSGNLPTARHHDPAYVIYTSGSTGRPKGVIIEHGSLLNRLNWMQRAYPVKTADMLIQKTPLVFDVSIWELFWWSVHGASLCLMKPGEEKDAQTILETIEKKRVTVIHFVPSMLNIFLQYLERSEETAKKLATLQKVFASGEALKPAQVEKFYKLVGKGKNAPRLINLYGPTEATVDVSYYNCPPDRHLSVIPIGKPIDNIRLYVVNRDLCLSPLGVAGELCIAGCGLARGYLNKPELTVDKFIFYRSYRSHMTYIPKKLYKTGDLVRWLPDGNIEFLGRIDNQVKIRGFRIELEEVEKHLLGSGLVKEAAVGIEADAQIGPRLTAYLVLKPGKAPTKNQLIDGLKTRLPEYMIPTDFVLLDRLCYTSSGKLDRKALAAQQHKKLEIQDHFTPPGSPIEEDVVKIWAEALGVETIGTRDNFFYLGGHSLLASKIILQVREAFGVDISLLTLFSTPTVEGMSQKINQLLNKN